MMSFIWPWMLTSLLLAPILIGVYIRVLKKRRQNDDGSGPLGFVQNAARLQPGKRRHIPPLLF